MATNDWDSEDTYWQGNYKDRPYAKTGEYDSYRGAYRYGYESANRYQGRQWNDVENDLKRDWDSYEHRGQSTWESIKDAARDAWDRVTGKR
jgi:hypothetical protein